MAIDVPGPELEERVGLFLDVMRPHWACRDCIARTLDLEIRGVKIALLRLARFRGREVLETACARCEGCGATTAVLRLRPPRILERIA
jgi:hypothetical protein